MKKAVLFLAVSVLMLMISCGDDQPTKNSKYVFDKRNIENDTNWVEFHDYDTLDGLCYYWHEVKGGVILNNLEEYREMFDRATKERLFTTFSRCHNTSDTVFVAPDIDFNNRSLVIFGMFFGDVEFKRKIYYNKNTEEYFYLLEVDYLSENALGHFYEDAISFPKVTNFEKIQFDTIVNYAY